MQKVAEIAAASCALVLLLGFAGSSRLQAAPASARAARTHIGTVARQRPLFQMRAQDRLFRSRRAGAMSVAASNTRDPAFALLFDCDGVIVLTEELHRIAYNKAFEKLDIRINGEPVEWSVEYYDILQNTVGGGKPKMKYHFNNNGMPSSSVTGVPNTAEELSTLVDILQDWKTIFYKEIVGEVATARPGVLELMDEAINNPEIAVGICSAATKEGFEKVVNAVVGPERLSKLDVVMAGDDVTRKKPDPLIYNLAREKIGLPKEKCVVIEDSIVGLKAAKGAGMNCIITYTSSTKDQDFFGEGADAVREDLSDVNLERIFRPMAEGSALAL
mmetsp:Transcript_38710/g.74328  ORF Transcript_38710/g.74328 Transcript_38710/m.74328 type:complete len:331 (-) Transcript_38710:158-1150(-)